MSLDVGNYLFEGPYTSPDSLEDKPGVFVVFCHLENEYKAIDCGAPDKVKSSVVNHGRRELWPNYCSGVLEFAVLYNDTERAAIEESLRNSFKFHCRDDSEKSGG